MLQNIPKRPRFGKSRLPKRPSAGGSWFGAKALLLGRSCGFSDCFIKETQAGLGTLQERITPLPNAAVFCTVLSFKTYSYVSAKDLSFFPAWRLLPSDRRKMPRMHHQHSQISHRSWHSKKREMPHVNTKSFSILWLHILSTSLYKFTDIFKPLKHWLQPNPALS